MTPELPQENLKLNRETAFQLYATFCGDVERTAHALNVTPGEVIDVAERCRWNEKLKVILALKRSAAPGDVERSINRAMNFVQAHRYRMFLDRVINEFTDMAPWQLRQYIFNEEETVKGDVHTTKRSLSTRALADLASALEKCHAATYLALSDTSSDRSRRDEADPGGEASGAIHAAIAKAMSEAGADRSPAALLFDAQTEQANGQLKRVDAALVFNPYDK